MESKFAVLQCYQKIREFISYLEVLVEDISDLTLNNCKNRRIEHFVEGNFVIVTQFLQL